VPSTIDFGSTTTLGAEEHPAMMAMTLTKNTD